MAVPMKGESLVKVEAGEFTLAFTLGACAAIEGQFEGRGLNSILKDIEGEGAKTSTLLVVIWAGLKKHHSLTLEEVGNIVTMQDMPLWGVAIGEAMGGGSMEATGPANPQKAAKRK